MRQTLLLISLYTLFLPIAGAGNIYLKPAEDPEGYLARLLINETPFPGERGWVSEENTKSAMSSILWVLHSRVRHVPRGYQRFELTATKSPNIFDVITAGGERGQCDGFYRDSNGTLSAVPRVEKRIDYLKQIGNDGSPGIFARLLNYAQDLASAYLSGRLLENDLFAELERISGTPVTGRAYSWMTDVDMYSPGGDYVRIPTANRGSLGGNRFFTLETRNE
jgi:hypothetical protein